MKTFIYKLLVFLVISFVVITFVATLPAYIIKQKASFKLNENINKVVFGHSHPECAYNDSLIANFKNLASSGESYFYTYQKIKKVIPDNPEIKSVFIEFTNNQIGEKMDDWIWGFEKMSNFLPIYYPFIEQKDYLLLHSNNSTDFLTSVSISSKKNFVRLLSLDYNYVKDLGGFMHLDEHITKRVLMDTKKEINYKSISKENLKYLRKIIDYCKSNNLNVFLIRSPQHPDYHFLNNENLFQEILRNNFSDMEFLDFQNFFIENEYFADYGHLNYKGAEVFSKYFNELIHD